MPDTFPGPDWKTPRGLHPVALDRFCERVLIEANSLIADAARTRHERDLALCDLIRERNKEMAKSFDDLRRSSALWRLAGIRSQGLLTYEEFARFGHETREAVQCLLVEP